MNPTPKRYLPESSRYAPCRLRSLHSKSIEPQPHVWIDITSKSMKVNTLTTWSILRHAPGVSLCWVGIPASQPSGDKVVCGQPSWKFLQQKSPQAKAYGKKENNKVIDTRHHSQWGISLQCEGIRCHKVFLAPTRWSEDHMLTFACHGSSTDSY